MKSLVLIGSNDYCKSVIEAAESSGYNILGILGFPDEVGNKVLSVPIVETADFIIASNHINQGSNRISLYTSAKKSGAHFATIIASTAYVSKYAHLGEGSVVMHKAFVNAGAKIGSNVFLDTLSNVDYEAVVGNHSIVSSNTIINGDSRVGERCIIGRHTTIDYGVHICNDVLLEDNSVVIEDVVTPGVYYGNPAKLVKQR
jgi:sugar O-acyltransferase (sialic acid O-acetyltransferase NeuD family)